MSPRAKTITVNLGVTITVLITIAASLWGGGKGVVTIADARYVRTDSFALRHALDSLNATAEYHAIRALLAGLDSSDRCRRNQTNYCR